MGDEKHEKKRLNRKRLELLNELRVAIPGVRLLFAFLLLPISAGGLALACAWFGTRYRSRRIRSSSSGR